MLGMTSDRERELAQKILDAAAPHMVGHTEEEIINALFAVLLERIEHDSDPPERARDMIEAIQANLLRH
jgi:hypothetical protein